MRSTWLFRLLSATLVFVLAGCGAIGNNRFSVTGNSLTDRSLTGNWSAIATATMSSMSSGMPSPMLSFTFSMAEGSMMMMMNPGASTTASVSISNLNVTSSSNCFDNMAIATASVVGAAGGSRTLTLQLSENGNTAMFSLAVPSNDNSASGNFALTGGHMLSTSTTPCVASASGTASFSRG